MKMMEMGLHNGGFNLNGGSQGIYLGIVGYTGMNIIDNMIRVCIVEPPFGLRLLLPFWCRRGGGIGARLVRGKGK